MAKAIGRASAPSNRKKPRHTAAQKKAAAKTRELSERSSRRDDRKSYAEKPAREDRPRREWSRDDRPRRDFDNRGPRREWNRDERPARDDRGRRREWKRDERPARDDRGPRPEWHRDDGA